MIVKTSQDSPLQINQLTVPSSAGVIGMTLCPGKKQRGGLTGDWDRDLYTDLKVVQDFRAVALVTLMEEHELDLFKVPANEFRHKAKELGFEWHHLPIPDGGIPGMGFERSWAYSGLRLRMHLAMGRKIVLHCLGGLGRTGTIAARLLVEMGTKPEDAIAAVRLARKHTIERPTQEAHVHSCSQVLMDQNPPTRQERIVACLLGGAVGDGFGYHVEFDKLDAIRERFGPAGLQEPVLRNGLLRVSDDTQMTLFTLEGLLRFKETETDSALDSVRSAYLDWLYTQGDMPPSYRPGCELAMEPSLRYRRAPGTTCLSALRAGGIGSTSAPINSSKGCGGVMRVAPVGLMIPNQSVEDAFRLAAECAALTHGHTSGFLSAGFLGAMLHLLILKGPIQEVLEKTRTILASWPGHEETSQAISKVMALAKNRELPAPKAIEQIGGGWVGEEALAIGLYAALVGKSYSEAVAIAVNHDGDSDSTASIAGQIWGAWKGLDGIPHDWIASLDVGLPISALIRRLETSFA